MIDIENNNDIIVNNDSDSKSLVAGDKKSSISSSSSVTTSIIPPFKSTLNRWVMVQSFFTGDDNQDKTYYLTRNPSNSSCLVTSTTNPSANSSDPTYANNQMWQLTSDGHILSTSGNVVLDVSNSKVITSTWNSNKSQLWTVDSVNNKIINQGNGQYLDINNLAAVTSPLNGNATQKWYFGPSYPLNSILQEAPQPFPQFTGGQLIAYQYISQALVPGCLDIRSQYVNLTQTSNFTSEMDQLPCPQGCTQQEFDQVKAQLSSEFRCVDSINSLFSYYDQFHEDLFSNSQALLNAIIVGLQLQTGKNSKIATGAIISLFETIIVTALAASSEIGPLLANIVQTAINIGVAYAKSGAHNAINPDPFQVSVANLWSFLSTNFVNLLAITGQMQSQLLSDWGMMQAAYQCTTILSGPGSLAWTPSTGPSILKTCQVGFITSIVQYLMPINYQIYVVKNSDQSNLPKNVPSSCIYKSGSHIYFVASNQQSTIFPTDSFMKTYIWGNNVNKDDFFKSQNLWNFPTSLAAARSWRSGSPTISNNTSVPMKINITVSKDSYNETLSTNSSFTYIYEDSNPQLPKLDGSTKSTFKVTEQISGNTVATFNYYVKSNTLEGYDIQLTSSSVSKGYKLAQTIVNQGNYSDGFSASIISSIYIDQQ